jgi:hypothetical protein
MAKTKTRHHSRALVRHSSPKPIVIRTTKIVKHKKRHSTRRGGGVGSLFSKDRITTVGAGFAVGALEKMAFVQNLPKLPFLGTTGTIGVGAFLISGGRRGMIDDVATAALTIAGYMMGSTGSIVGGDGGVDTSGYVAGF